MLENSRVFVLLPGYFNKGNMKRYIETPRLILRGWREEDVAPFARINSDEQVMEYFLKKLDEEETRVFYRRIADEFADCGWGLYAVEDKADRSFIGYVGFHRIGFEVDFAPGIEIGWRLRKESWGKGLATEAAAACLEYGRDVLGLKEVYSFTSLLNKRSERVMQKIGMSFAGEFGHPLVDPAHVLYKHVLYKKLL